MNTLPDAANLPRQLFVDLLVSLIRSAPALDAIYYVCRPMIYSLKEFADLPTESRSTDKLQVMAGYTRLSDDLLDMYVNCAVEQPQEADGCVVEARVLADPKRRVRYSRTANDYYRPEPLDVAIQAIGAFYAGYAPWPHGFPTVQELHKETLHLFGLPWAAMRGAKWPEVFTGFSQASQQAGQGPSAYHQVLMTPLRKPALHLPHGADINVYLPPAKTTKKPKASVPQKDESGARDARPAIKKGFDRAPFLK